MPSSAPLRRSIPKRDSISLSFPAASRGEPRSVAMRDVGTATNWRLEEFFSSL